MSATPALHDRNSRVHAREVVRAAVVDAPNLAELVTHYQTKLRLLDWRIDVSYQRDLTTQDGREVWGLCYPNVDAKAARIVVRDPSTPPAGATAEQAAATVVETVVHELLHLHFAPFQHAAPTEVAAEEQAVWAIAEALVRARGSAEEEPIARAVARRLETFARSSRDLALEKTMSLDPKMAEEAVAILVKKDQKAALSFVERFVISAVGGSAEEPAPSEPAPSEPASPEPPPGEMAAPEAPAEEETPRARTVVDAPLEAFARAALALTGKTDPAEALAELTRHREAVVELEQREQEVSRSRAVLEGGERRKLVARLVALQAEAPATAWVLDADGRPTNEPVKRLADEPIAELRSRVEVLERARGTGRAVSPPVGGDAAAKLSPRELKMCADMKIDPKVYAATKAAKGKA